MVNFRFVDESANLFKAVDRKTWRVLGKAGAFTRRDVRKSLGKAPKKAAVSRFKKTLEEYRQFKATKEELAAAQKQTVSPPGKAPFKQKGTLRALVSYARDRTRKTVVIGPERFMSKSTPVGGKTGAELLETGGGLLIKTPQSRFVAQVVRRPYMEQNAIKAREKFIRLMEQENL